MDEELKKNIRYNLQQTKKIFKFILNGKEKKL